jgi:hypothetical protein
MLDTIASTLSIYVAALILAAPVIFFIWLIAEIRHFLRSHLA